MKARALRLTLGPILYYWPRQRVFTFYDEIARSAADVVYLGEVVCSRRHELAFEDWLAVGEALADAGKEVVLSAQALTESEGDLKLMRRVIGNGRFRVEANDMGSVRLLCKTVGWVAGPHLNVYNPQTLAMLFEAGARRWVAPAEAPRQVVASVLAARAGGAEDGLEAEVFAHGRLPLAFSARCFTARRFQLQKESCEYRCLGYADGLPLATREGEPFLVVNGVQTLSADVHCLVDELDFVRSAGIGLLRISPQSNGTAETLEVWRDRIEGRLDALEARRSLAECAPGALCNGFWHALPGMETLR